LAQVSIPSERHSHKQVEYWYYSNYQWYVEILFAAALLIKISRQFMISIFLTYYIHTLLYLKESESRYKAIKYKFAMLMYLFHQLSAHTAHIRTVQLAIAF